MSDGTKDRRSAERDARQARLAAALRQNLRRRKAAGAEPPTGAASGAGAPQDAPDSSLD